MRKTTVAAMALVAVLSGVASSTAEAAQPKPVPLARHVHAQPIDYYAPHRGSQVYGGRERRSDWGAQSRAHDRARIAEAARREAMRIERERATRRAWRHDQRSQFGQYRGW
jgi:hypothetical protein